MSESPITPVIVGDAARAMALSDRLFARGVFAQGIGFPTVARDKARVRTIVTATHTREELQFALDAFAHLGALRREVEEQCAETSMDGPSSRRSAESKRLGPVA